MSPTFDDFHVEIERCGQIERAPTCGVKPGSAIMISSSVALVLKSYVYRFHLKIGGAETCDFHKTKSPPLEVHMNSYLVKQGVRFFVIVDDDALFTHYLPVPTVLLIYIIQYIYFTTEF